MYKILISLLLQFEALNGGAKDVYILNNLKNRPWRASGISRSERKRLLRASQWSPGSLRSYQTFFDSLLCKTRSISITSINNGRREGWLFEWLYSPSTLADSGEVVTHVNSAARGACAWQSLHADVECKFYSSTLELFQQKKSRSRSFVLYFYSRKKEKPPLMRLHSKKIQANSPNNKHIY